jgi:hypothetical protein
LDGPLYVKFHVSNTLSKLGIASHTETMNLAETQPFSYQGAFIKNAIVIAVAETMHANVMMVTAAMAAMATVFPCIPVELVGVSLGSESSSFIGNLLMDIGTPSCTLQRVYTISRPSQPSRDLFC